MLIIMIWIGLGNLAPLYLGSELLFGRRDSNDNDEMVEELAEMQGELEEMKEDLTEIQSENGRE